MSVCVCICLCIFVPAYVRACVYSFECVCVRVFVCVILPTDILMSSFVSLLPVHECVSLEALPELDLLPPLLPPVHDKEKTAGSLPYQRQDQGPAREPDSRAAPAWTQKNEPVSHEKICSSMSGMRILQGGPHHGPHRTVG